MQDLQVYTLVPRSGLPPGQKAICLVEVGLQGENRRHAQGAFGGKGVELSCGGTFSPVCRIQSIHMVLAIATEMNWEVVQLDMKTAFLYADIEDDVLVEIAPGYETTNRKGVQLMMKLGKSLYGLAQSPYNWWKTVDPSLVGIIFVPLKSETCVYIYSHKNTVVILTLYPDDLLIIGGKIQVIETIKKKLKGTFKMTAMGDVSLVLGMQVTRDRERGTLTIT